MKLNKTDLEKLKFDKIVFNSELVKKQHHLPVKTDPF